jgi:hypothetical protein
MEEHEAAVVAEMTGGVSGDQPAAGTGRFQMMREDDRVRSVPLTRTRCTNRAVVRRVRHSLPVLAGERTVEQGSST